MVIERNSHQYFYGKSSIYFCSDSVKPYNDWNKKYSQLFPMRIVA